MNKRQKQWYKVEKLGIAPHVSQFSPKSCTVVFIWKRSQDSKTCGGTSQLCCLAGITNSTGFLHCDTLLRGMDTLIHASQHVLQHGLSHISFLQSWRTRVGAANRCRHKPRPVPANLCGQPNYFSLPEQLKVVICFDLRSSGLEGAE